MIKSNKLALCTVLVLTCGLVSCAKNKEDKKDVYLAPVPIILKGAQRISLVSWERAQQKDLDIQDGIDVRAAGATSVDVISRCRRGNGDVYRSMTLPGAQPIWLYQVLAAEILAHDLAQMPVSCSFELILRNTAGSKHIYNLGTAMIKDERVGNAALEMHGTIAPQMRQKFKFNALEGVKIRSNRKLAGQAQLLCGDGISPELTFDTVIEAGNFEFTKMQVYQNRTEHAFERTPLQLCRGVVLKDGVMQAMTSLFEFQFNYTSVNVRALVSIAHGGNPLLEQLQSAISGGSVFLSLYGVRNNSPTPRIVRMPKNNLNARVLGVQTDNQIHMVTRPFVTVALKDGQSLNVVDEGPSFRIVVGPGEEAAVAIGFKAAAPSQCLPNIRASPLRVTPNPLKSLVIEPTQSLHLEELTEANQTLGRVTIDPEPRMFLGIRAVEATGLNLALRGEVSYCGW